MPVEGNRQYSASRGLLPDSSFCAKHRSWLAGQSFDHPALSATFARYRATVACREAELEALEADLQRYLTIEPFAAAVARLAAYRGVERLGGLVLQAEVCDRRRFSGRDDPGSFCGLVTPIPAPPCAMTELGCHSTATLPTSWRPSWPAPPANGPRRSGVPNTGGARRPTRRSGRVT